MLKRSLVIGATSLALLGGGAAVAYAAGPTDGSSSAPVTTSSSPSVSPSAPAHPAAGMVRKALRRSVHVTWVTRGPKGQFVTHDAIRGQVKAVSGQSINVMAADGTSETFTVAGTTKVREVKAGSKPTDSTISQVAVGDRVLVVGAGTPDPTARLIRVVTK